jgi:hypothetical protein
MTRGSGRAHLARATLEAMTLQNVDILMAMEKDLGKRMGSVRVDGGAVRNDLLMQMQADFWACPACGQRWLRQRHWGRRSWLALAPVFGRTSALLSRCGSKTGFLCRSTRQSSGPRAWFIGMEL